MKKNTKVEPEDVNINPPLLNNIILFLPINFIQTASIALSQKTQKPTHQYMQKPAKSHPITTI